MCPPFRLWLAACGELTQAFSPATWLMVLSPFALIGRHRRLFRHLTRNNSTNTRQQRLAKCRSAGRARLFSKPSSTQTTYKRLRLLEPCAQVARRREFATHRRPGDRDCFGYAQRRRRRVDSNGRLSHSRTRRRVRIRKGWMLGGFVKFEAWAGFAPSRQIKVPPRQVAGGLPCQVS